MRLRKDRSVAARTKSTKLWRFSVGRGSAQQLRRARKKSGVAVETLSRNVTVAD